MNLFHSKNDRGYGCSCTSCRITNTYADKGFDTWPRGDSKTPAQARKEYAQHVSHLWAGVPRTLPQIDYDAANFYRCPATPMSEIRATLARTFAETLPDSAFTPIGDQT